MRTQTYIEIGYQELDNLVNQLFGSQKDNPHPHDGYEFVAIQECNNDSDHGFDLTKPTPEEDLSKWDKEALKEAYQGRFSPYNNYLYLEELVRKGVLKPA